MDGKTKAFLDDMRSRNVNYGIVAPTLWRVAWRIGLPLLPAFFWPSWLLVPTLGLSFGAPLLVVLACLEPYREYPLSFGQLVLAAGAGGLLFGAIITIAIRSKARTLRLTDWESYAPPPTA